MKVVGRQHNNKEVKVVKGTALTDVTRNWGGCMALPKDQASVKKENRSYSFPFW